LKARHKLKATSPKSAFKKTGLLKKVKSELSS